MKFASWSARRERVVYKLDVKLPAEYGNMRTDLPASSLPSSAVKTGEACPIMPVEYLREIAIVSLFFLHPFSPYNMA